MDRLKLPGRPRSIPQKQAAAAIGQGLLMHTYAQAFAPHDIPVGQVLLTREDLRERTRYLNARNTFDALLGHHVVPIVNENDTVAVDEIKFGDNDTLAALVASLIEADALLLLSDVAGLYDRDPTQFPEAQLIPVVETIDRAVEQRAGGAQTGMGTGGMTTKVQAAKICANTNVHMFIADGRRASVVADALNGLCGTHFLPKPTRLRSRQRWIAYGVLPKGTVTVNDGARLRVTGEGKASCPPASPMSPATSRPETWCASPTPTVTPSPRASSITPRPACQDHGPPHRGHPAPPRHGRRGRSHPPR